jgi:DNA processing protein
MSGSRLHDWIALNLLPGLGSVLLRRALERFGDPHDVAHRVPAASLASIPGIGPETVAAVSRARHRLAERAEREWRRADKLGLRILACDDPEFPAALADLAGGPILLYVRGELRPGTTRVAVVGSRQATLYGQRVATGLAGGLAARRIEIVSGGARGVDTCAHRAALDEPGGRTVAVLGSGFLHPYPEENVPLFNRIAESGAVVSEFPLDDPPRPENFPRRNRIISGLSAAVVVVEASRKSGSLGTAAHALEQGREVLAVPGPVSSPRSEGCNRLIQQGAKLVQCLDDIVEELSPMYRGAVEPAPPPAPAPGAADLSDDERTVLALLDPIEPLHVEELADRVPFGIARLQAALFGLQACGAADQLPGARYLVREDGVKS